MSKLPGTQISEVILLGFLACILVIYLSSRKGGIPKGLRLPPGPPGKLIFGNAGDFPKHHEWETVAQWGKTYGGVVHLKVLNTHVVYVNSPDVARELFDKRSSIYSDRFLTPMCDLIGCAWITPFIPYGEMLRRHRTNFSKVFNQTACTTFYDVQTKHTRSLLKNLLESPEQFMKHVRHHSGAIILEITYGIQVLPDEDPFIRYAEEAMSAITKAARPGAFLVDVLPIRSQVKYIPVWMPGAGFRKKAQAWNVAVSRSAVAPFEYVKNAIAAGTAAPSFLLTLLEELSGPDPDEEAVMRSAAGTAYLGGSETTVSTLASFINVMALHPAIQRRAQEELDSVIGDRVPLFNDRKDLLYVDALTKEVLRFYPAVPLITPHRLSQDDVYGDLFIPKGSIIIGNAWAMLRSEKYFGSEPDKFIPDRFLKPGINYPDFFFGFGRRICPGRHLADNTIFIAIASVLKLFDIVPARDSTGHEISVTDERTSGGVSYPAPFACAFKLRSGAENLLSEISH